MATDVNHSTSRRFFDASGKLPVEKMIKAQGLGIAQACSDMLLDWGAEVASSLVPGGGAAVKGLGKFTAASAP